MIVFILNPIKKNAFLFELKELQILAFIPIHLERFPSSLNVYNYILEEHDSPSVNWLTKIILLAKVNFGYPIETIQEGMREFVIKYDGNRKPNSDNLECILTVYMQIAISEQYFENERRAAFNEIQKIIDRQDSEHIEYFMFDSEFQELKKSYKILCEKYQVDLPIIMIPDETNKKMKEKILFNSGFYLNNDKLDRDNPEKDLVKNHIFFI